MRKRKADMFKIDPQITTLLKDYEDDVVKKRKIVARNNGDLFYVFKPLEEKKDGRPLGKS